MAFDVGAVVGHLQLKKDQWNQAIADVKKDQKSLQGLVLRNSQQFKQMGRAMTVAGGAIIGTVGLMVKAYATFDKSMTESLAIMGDVSDEMRKDMAKAALEMSTKTTFSAKELAKAYFFLASAGMDAAQSIKALPVVAKFAQAGTFDLSVATDLLTDAQTALGLSSKDAVKNQKNLIRVSDVLVGANTLANASVKQFAESLTNKAAAAMVQLNMEVEEGVAVLAAYADKGIKGQLAGQRLTMMLNGLFDASRRNKKAWDEAGISLFNADESFRKTADIIQDLEGYLGAMTVKQREAALATLGFNLRTKSSILTLMGSSEKIREWNGNLKEMGGITEEVSEKQLETLINQITILKNKIIEAAISIGETLGPALKSTIENLKKTVGNVAAWIKEHPKLTEIIAKSAVAVGGLLTVLGPLMMMLPGLVIILPKLAIGFSALLAPITAVAVGITAVGIAVNALTNAYQKRLDAEADAMINAAKSHANFWAFRRSLIKEEIVTVEEWAEIYKRHGRNYKRVMIAIAQLPEYAHIKKHWEELKGKTEKATEALSKTTGVLTVQLPVVRGLAIEYENWGQGVYTLNEFLNDLADWKPPVSEFNALLPPMREFIGLVNAIPGGVEEATETIKKFPKDTADAISEAIGILSYLGMYNKTLAYASAVINTAQAVTKALSAYPPPLSFIMAAVTAAAGAIEIATIAGTSIPSAEKGAYLPEPALVEAGHGRLGEVVLPLDRAPIDFAREVGRETTEGAKVNFNFYAPIISTTGLSGRDLDMAVDDLFFRMEREAARRGFKLIGG